MPEINESIFTPSQPNRVFDAVVDQVEEAVYKGELSPGDRLPPERRLQELVGISRNTLREAIRVLEQKGLVEIRKGHKGGIFIKQVTAGPMCDDLATFVRSNGVSLEHIAQFREDLEGLLAGRAAETATRMDCSRLEALVGELASLYKEGLEAWDRFMETDRRIHMAIAAISANPIHCMFLETVHNSLHRQNVAAFLKKDKRYLKECLQDMTAIVTAIGGGNKAAAEKAAKQHVLHALKRMHKGSPQP